MTLTTTGRFFLGLSVGAVALSMTACDVIGLSSNRPENDDIRKALGMGIAQNAFANCDKSYLTVDNIEKTNGIDNGNFYRVSYNYDLVFLKDIPSVDVYNAVAKSEGDLSPNALEISTCYAALGQAGVIGIEGGKLSTMPRKGDRIAMVGEMNMIRSENGWIEDR